MGRIIKGPNHKKRNKGRKYSVDKGKNHFVKWPLYETKKDGMLFELLLIPTLSFFFEVLGQAYYNMQNWGVIVAITLIGVWVKEK